MHRHKIYVSVREFYPNRSECVHISKRIHIHKIYNTYTSVYKNSILTDP